MTEFMGINPAYCSKDDIASRPLVRASVYNEILSSYLNATEGSVRQCIYLHGGKGSGKTFMLKRLQADCSGDRFVSYVDCAFETGRYLEKLCEHIESGEIPGNGLILIDNFDGIASSCSTDRLYNLRRLLSKPGSPMVVATGSRILPMFVKYDAVFYDFFRLMQLGPLDEAGIINVAEHICGSAHGKTARLVRESCILFGNSPLIATIAAMNIKAGCKTSEDIAMGIADVVSPYCEHVLESLPDAAREILLALMKSPQGCLLPELRELTGMSNSLIPVYIKRLVYAGLVTLEKTKARNSRYHASDPLLTAMGTFKSS